MYRKLKKGKMKVNLRCTYVYAPDGIWKTIPDEPGGARNWIPGSIN